MQSVVAPLCEAVLFGWCLREGVRASVAISCSPHLMRPLRKPISSQLALSSTELLSLKIPIFKVRR